MTLPLPPDPPCECPGPGWCDRYQIEQQGYPHEVCQGLHGAEKGARYRAKWRCHVIQMGEPGLVCKIRNVAKATAKHVATGRVLVPLSVVAERQAICNGCADFHDAERNICKHPACGCPAAGKHILMGTIQRPGKLEWASQRCPMGYWGPWKPEPAPPPV